MCEFHANVRILQTFAKKVPLVVQVYIKIYMYVSLSFSDCSRKVVVAVVVVISSHSSSCSSGSGSSSSSRNKQSFSGLALPELAWFQKACACGLARAHPLLLTFLRLKSCESSTLKAVGLVKSIDFSISR